MPDTILYLCKRLDAHVPVTRKDDSGEIIVPCTCYDGKKRNYPCTYFSHLCLGSMSPRKCIVKLKAQREEKKNLSSKISSY